MNKKAIDKITELWDELQTFKNSYLELENKIEELYSNLKYFCLECDILTIEDFREIEKNVK